MVNTIHFCSSRYNLLPTTRVCQLKTFITGFYIYTCTGTFSVTTLSLSGNLLFNIWSLPLVWKIACCLLAFKCRFREQVDRLDFSWRNCHCIIICRIMTLWRSVTPTFTGANYTLLYFVNIRFYLMVTSLKRLWAAAHSQFSPSGVVLCVIQRGPLNELQENRFSLL